MRQLSQRVKLLKLILEKHFALSEFLNISISRYMRQNSKDVSLADQAIVTVEKTSRKIVLTTAASTQSQVTMSLVTSSPSIAKSAVQVHNLSKQQSNSPAPSTQLSLVPAGTSTSNSVNNPAPIVSATASAPLSIQLARPQPQPHPNGPTTHQTLTVVPGSLRLDQPSLVVVRQAGDLGSNPAQPQKHQAQHQQHHQSKPQTLSEQQDLSITNANSVKELWINRITPTPSMNSSQHESRTSSGKINLDNYFDFHVCLHFPSAYVRLSEN